MVSHFSAEAKANKQFISQKTAVFSDIHSNYHAFQACYEDAVRSGVDLFIFLGDYVSDLPDPRRVMDLLCEIRETYPTVCLRGNRERYMLERAHRKTQFSPGSKTGSLLYTFQQLRQADISFFESLPIYDLIEINGIPFEIAHAAKEDDRFFFTGTDDQTEHVLEQMEYPYMLAGHSHKQFLRSSGGKTILNPGSIGVPRDHGHLSQYAIMEFHENRVAFDLRQIPYDVEGLIRQQFKSELMDIAPHWAISILYDVICGKECTMVLLDRLSAYADGRDAVFQDETLWHQTAADMGMKFTCKEIMDTFHTVSRQESQ